MEIEFGNKKLKKLCERRKEAVRKWGAVTAKIVMQRLVEMGAADTLEVLHRLPKPRCHQLKGNRAGQFAVDLKHPFRLIFEPVGDPSAFREKNEIILSRVTKVKILEITDYHG